MKRLARRSLGFVPIHEGQYRVPPPQPIPSTVPRPDYVSRPGGRPKPPPESTFAEAKQPEEIARMRRACQLARDALRAAMATAGVGVTAHDVDRAAHEVIVAAGAYPVGVGFHGFPKGSCISPNEVACHGIPDERPLADGDIINIDVTCFLDGAYGDNSAMVLVGNVDPEGQRLVEVCKQCRDDAVALCQPGERFSSIGRVITEIAQSHGYSVCESFNGHFIGRALHMQPNILHFFPNELHDLRMTPGQTFTIEPIINQGSKEVIILGDGWTTVTKDGRRSAQWEHTVLITEYGHEVLTPL